MKREQLREMIHWLHQQIAFANRLIDEAKEKKNYGKETEYVGMRDAFVKCLNRLPGAGSVIKS